MSLKQGHGVPQDSKRALHFLSLDLGKAEQEMKVPLVLIKAGMHMCPWKPAMWKPACYTVKVCSTCSVPFG